MYYMEINTNENEIYKPLQIWFTEPGFAIPFVVLQYSDVKRKLVQDIINNLSKKNWSELRKYNNFILEDPNNKKDNCGGCEGIYETLHNFFTHFLNDQSTL